MKVRCVKLINDVGHVLDQSPWLQIGKVYHVLAINVSEGGGTKFAIQSGSKPDEFPSLSHHMSSCFEVISTSIPSNWRPWVDGAGNIGISPAAWQVPKFADNLADCAPWVQETYFRERDLIIEEDP